jgi:uncharacterized protein (DUF2062 family)
MPKKLLKRYIPDPAELRQNKYLKAFARFLEDPNLFHMNRRSVANAFLSGLFWAMIPMPVQMVAATITALLIRGINLPISVALVWITNPLTMPPMFYFNYLVGTWILGEPENSPAFEASLEWLVTLAENNWYHLYFGSFVVGVISGLIGYFGIRWYWRYYIVKKHRSRSWR